MSTPRRSGCPGGSPRHRRMDATEGLVETHLQHRGFEDIRFEPDGNVPPDFLVNGEIAIEARRLNQHEREPALPRGLEETSIPLRRTVQRVLDDLGPPRHGARWFVNFSFSRPLPPRPVVVRALGDALEQFACQSEPECFRFRLGAALSVRLSRAGQMHPRMFVLGATSDHDDGGFVVAELERNLSICLNDKTQKIAPYRRRYPVWWLVLVDRIAYASLDSQDLKVVRGLVAGLNQGAWNKIVLVSPLDAARSLDLGLNGCVPRLRSPLS
jgi:hypothetical protein